MNNFELWNYDFLMYYIFVILQDSLSSVDSLLKKHENFTTSLEAQREKIAALEQLTQVLLSQDHYASKQIELRRKGVVDRMDRVLQMTEARHQKLVDSRNYQQFLCNVYEVMSLLLFVQTLL